MAEVRAQMVASVIAVPAAVGDHVDAGQTVLVVESMKMEIPVLAPAAGVLQRLEVAVGDVVEEGDLLAVVAPLQPGSP